MGARCRRFLLIAANAAQKKNTITYTLSSQALAIHMSTMSSISNTNITATPAVGWITTATINTLNSCYKAVSIRD